MNRRRIRGSGPREPHPPEYRWISWKRSLWAPNTDGLRSLHGCQIHIGADGVGRIGGDYERIEAIFDRLCLKDGDDAIFDRGSFLKDVDDAIFDRRMLMMRSLIAYVWRIVMMRSLIAYFWRRCWWCDLWSLIFEGLWWCDLWSLIFDLIFQGINVGRAGNWPSCAVRL